MDAKLSVVVQHHCHLSPLCHPRHKHRSDHSPSPCVVAVLSRSPDKSVELSGTMASRTVYKDNWFDRAAINHLSQRLQETTGLRSRKSGYDGLVEAAGVAYRKFNSSQQQDLIIQTLEKAFPRPILSAVRESEFDGTKEKNVVHIKKCRFLEGTNCVGMCTNLCKMSSQEFIKDSLGMPLNMVPNFDDMSCDMTFGQEPPLVINDPAFVQPCYKICKENKKNHKNCTSQ
ncbi:beta-carotene isomerase D27, chloroplastic-like isoform X2 [Coffea arabica]|uniref:Beta-carotene isomerase D27, chloroplastic-like isoform X2 n=1 Tax=Coffea arabica TaxID=13443 RepID=A0ABM4VKZ9_COFAR